MSDTRNYQLIYPDSEDYSAGYVEVHHTHNSHEAQRNIETAIILAKLGYQVRLLPIDNTPYTKNPDAYFIREETEVEFKHNLTPTRSAIEKAIKYASKQSKQLVLHILSDVDRQDLVAGIKSKFFFFQRMEMRWTIWKNEVYRFDRNAIFDGTLEQKIK